MGSKRNRAFAITQRRRCDELHDPARHLGAAGFFSPPIHSHAQVWCVSYIQGRAICYLGAESLALRTCAIWRGPSGWSQSRGARGSRAA
jgi:hypothetical protein